MSLRTKREVAEYWKDCQDRPCQWTIHGAVTLGDRFVQWYGETIDEYLARCTR